LGWLFDQLDNSHPTRKVAEVEFAFQYTHDTHTTEIMFVNTLETPDGGTHLTGLRAALTSTINQWAQKTGQATLSGRQTRKGL
jgi:DNA gyrase subunit B